MSIEYVLQRLLNLIIFYFSAKYRLLERCSDNFVIFLLTHQEDNS